MPLLRIDGWDVIVVPTPAAAVWIEEAAVAEATGRPVRSTPRGPDEPKSTPPLSAVAVVPATFNTINKWAGGISDNQALGILNEALGQSLPIVVLPVVKAPLAAHPAYPASLATLRSAGVSILEGALAGTPEMWPAVCNALRQA